MWYQCKYSGLQGHQTLLESVQKQQVAFCGKKEKEREREENINTTQQNQHNNSIDLSISLSLSLSLRGGVCGEEKR